MWRDEGTREPLSQGEDVLAEDNKRLQEMLHSALRREAEALRRVKHLSAMLAALGCEDGNAPSCSKAECTFLNQFYLLS